MIPGSGRSPGGGHDNPLQYSCLKNPMDRGIWRGTSEEELQSSWSSILQALPSPSRSVCGPWRAHSLQRLALRRVGNSPTWVQGRDTWMAFCPKGGRMWGRAHVPKKFPQSHTHACVHAQSFPTLCNPMGHSPPGSSVHGILQARVLEWVAIFFSRGSSQGSNPHLLRLLHWQAGSLPLAPPGNP